MANLITIMMAIRLYEAKEGIEYREYTTRGLVKAGYLPEELTCPASGAYYRVDPDLDIAFCPSGIPGHSWPSQEE